MFHSPSSFHSFSNHVQICASCWTHVAAQGLNKSLAFSSVPFSHSVMSDSLWPHGRTAARQASLSITNSWSILKLMPIKLMMSSNNHLLSSPSPPTFNLSQHQGLFNESVLPIRWPKYWSFSFNISPSNEYSGQISFRIDCFDLAVQGTLKSLLQHHSSKASIIWH